MSLFRIRNTKTGTYHKGGATTIISERYCFSNVGKVWASKSAFSNFFAQYRDRKYTKSDVEYYAIPDLLNRDHWEVIEYFDDAFPKVTPFIEFFKEQVLSSKHLKKEAKEHGIDLTTIFGDSDV